MNVIFDHWAQIAFFLGAVGYVIGKFIESKNKESEIRFSELHVNKIIEIKAFYKSYQLLRIALQQLHYQIEFRKHDQEVFNTLRQDIAKKFIEFDYNLMVVKLFIDLQDMAVLNEIRGELAKVDLGLYATIYKLKSPTSQSLPDDLNAISNVFDETLPVLINRIETSLRNNFKLK